jgi:hypothetical protein
MEGKRRWRPDWAKGLTAATHPGLARMAAWRRGRPSWAKGLTAADHPAIARQAATRRGQKRGPYRTHGRPLDESTIDPRDLLLPERWSDYAYLLGLYLGDGSITKAKRLEIFLDARQVEIIDSCVSAMRAIHPRGRANVRWKREENCAVVNSYAWQWLVLFPQHGPGRKHLRKIELAEWQTEIAKRYCLDLLHGLIDSDGSRFDRWVGGKNYPAYDFRNESADILAIFRAAADTAGVHYTQSKPTTISIARRADVERLDAIWPIKRPGRSDQSE